MATATAETPRSFSSLVRLLREAPPIESAAVIGLMLVSALIDGAGILLMVPVLRVMTGVSMHTNATNHASPAVQDADALGRLLALLVGLVVVRVVLRWAGEVANARLQFRIVDQLRVRCLKLPVN